MDITFAQSIFSVINLILLAGSFALLVFIAVLLVKHFKK